MTTDERLHQCQKDVLLHFLLKDSLFYLSHLYLQSIWVWYLCMVWSRDSQLIQYHLLKVRKILSLLNYSVAHINEIIEYVWGFCLYSVLVDRSYAKNRKCKDFVIFLHLKLCIFSFSHFQFFHFMLLFSCFFIYFLLFLQYLVLSIILTIIAWQVKGLLFQSPQQQNCVRRTGVFSPWTFP